MPVGESPNSSWRRLGIGSLLAVIGLAAVVGTWSIARDAPSSRSGQVDGIPYHAVSGAEGCQNFADYWMKESGVGLDPASIEQFTNCRTSSDGGWKLAAEAPNADPLSELSNEDQQAAAALQQRVLSGVKLIETSMPDDLGDQVFGLHSQRDNPVIGHQLEGVSISSIRARYVRVVNAVMLDPAYADFADYLGWLMGQRIEGYSHLRTDCLDNPDTGYLFQPCTGLEDNLSIRYAPWPWDMRDPVNLDAYLLSVFGDNASES